MDQKTSELLKKIIPGLQIDVPIVAARIVGNRLELTLYGGEQRSISLPAQSDVSEAHAVEGPAADDDVGARQAVPTAKKITKKSKKR